MSCPFKPLHPSSPVVTGDSGNKHPPDDDGGCQNNVNKVITFMQASPDAAFLLDQEGKIVYRNKASQLMFTNPTGLTGLTLTSIFSFIPHPHSSSSFTAIAVSSWDDLATNLTSEPQHHHVIVPGNGDNDSNNQFAFTLNLLKLPSELMDNKDILALAYVIPAHDGVNKDGMRPSNEEEELHTIAEGGSIVTPDELQMKEKLLRRHMQDVVQASLDPMFSIREDGKIAMANDVAVELFGYNHDELVGLSIANICSTAREMQNILNFMKAPSINKQQITTATTKTGEELSIELGLSLNQTFSGGNTPIYFAHMKDLTALEEQKTEIEHKDTLCQQMINASFDPMFAIDQRGKIIVVNNAACQMFGYAREEFIDQNIKMICNERDAKKHDKHMHRYIKTGEKRVIGKKRDLVARRKDGSEFHIELGVSEVQLNNGEKMFCGYVRDRTQERLDKQMLRRKEAVIQDKFFQQPEDARGALKRDAARYTQ